MHNQKVASTVKITETRSLFQRGFFWGEWAFICPQHSGDPSYGWSLTKNTCSHKGQRKHEASVNAVSKHVIENK